VTIKRTTTQTQLDDTGRTGSVVLNQREGERYMEGKWKIGGGKEEKLNSMGDRPSCTCENRKVVVVVANIFSLYHDFLCVLLLHS